VSSHQIRMHFTLFNLLLLAVVVGAIFWQLLVRVLLPAFWRSRAGRKFNKRVSKIVFNLFWEILRDVTAHLITMTEYDGDEPYQPYLDSPLRTCPPCQLVSSPPKEESNNNMINPPPGGRPIPAARRGGRGRGRLQGPPAVRLRIPADFRRHLLHQVPHLLPPVSPPPVFNAQDLLAAPMINRLEQLRRRREELMRQIQVLEGDD